MTTPEPADLRHVAAADVYLGDTAVATLTRAAGDDIVFQYTTTAPPPGAPIRASSVSWSLPADARTPAGDLGRAGGCGPRRPSASASCGRRARRPVQPRTGHAPSFGSSIPVAPFVSSRP